MQTVGKNIAAVRARLSLSQVQLADRLGVRQPSVWKLEHSAGLPGTDTLLKVAIALDVVVDELLQGVNLSYDTIVIRERDLLRHAIGVELASNLQPQEGGSHASTPSRIALNQFAQDLDTLDSLAHTLVSEIQNVARRLDGRVATHTDTPTDRRHRPRPAVRVRRR